jgi:pimeloyl-ACP methyl ester carboxylesterase
MRHLLRDLGLLLIPSLLASCLSPAARIDHQAQHIGLQRSVIEGEGYDHVVYQRQVFGIEGPLHIYLEGDGSPWIDESRIASDPTPRRAYALELMALDSRAAAYVGRPCYHGQEGTQPCDPLLWTHDRYSKQVVDSLEFVIRQITAREARKGLVLIGYSGGGVLAMLLAERLETTRSVVTIAANLDIDAWTDLHDYSPLVGSLNPARRPPLPPGIRQFHLAGGRDDRVPTQIIESVADTQSNCEILIYPEFDHTCCWSAIWPQVLNQIAHPPS